MLFPNPTRDGFAIRGAWANQTPLQIFIYDDTGKLWLREKGNYSDDYFISTANLNSGTYYVTAVAPGNRYTEKLVVMK